MEDIETKISQNQPLKTQKIFIGAQIFLRIVVIAASFASTWLMLTNKQTIDIGGFVLDANYSYSPEFKYDELRNLLSFSFFLFAIYFLWKVKDFKILYFAGFFLTQTLLLVPSLSCLYCFLFLLVVEAPILPTISSYSFMIWYALFSSTLL